MTTKNICLQAVGIIIAIYFVPVYAQHADFDRADRHCDHRGHGKQHSVARVFNKLDADKDGVVNLAEFLAPIGEKTEKKFNRKDTDDDGLISFDEFLAGSRPYRDADFDIDRDAVRACVEAKLGI